MPRTFAVVSATPAHGIRRVVVEVPASSANLGAGYDALGLALDVVNRVEVAVRGTAGVEIHVEGEGANELEAPQSNRFVAAFERGVETWGRDRAPAGWAVRMHNAIPLGRGLGSSGAATVAGLVAAATFTERDARSDEVLALAAELEGHADNAAAALLGGLVAVAHIGGRWETVRLDPPDVAVVVFVPELRLATEDMRRVLPPTVPLGDAVFNVGRVAVGIARLAAGDAAGFRPLTEDRLHEQYRAAAYPALAPLLAAAREAGALGACLSGSGSSVVAFADSPAIADRVAAAFRAEAEAHGLAGRALATTIRAAGATVLESD